MNIFGSKYSGTGCNIVYEKRIVGSYRRHTFYINSYLVTKMNDTGSYIITVKDCEKNGPTGVFVISKSMTHLSGNIVSLSYSEGERSSFHVEWNPGEYPSIVIQYNKPVKDCKVCYSINVF